MAIVGGVTIPLFMFLLWDAAILGNAGVLGGGGSSSNDPLAALAAQSGAVGPLLQAFSMLAVATSYIGFILGLSDFISDALKVLA